MGHRRLAGAVVTCVILSFAVGCGSADGLGSGAASKSSAPSSTAPLLPRDGAPAVADPLSLAPLVQDRCAAPTKDQIETLGGAVRTVIPDSGFVDAGGPNTGCGWILADGLGNIVGGPVTSVHEGLSDLYGANRAVTANGGQSTLRELAPVEGYPAIQSTQGFEGDQSCIVLVGVSNTQVYGVRTSISQRHPYFRDACGLASKVAAFAIQYLKTR